MQKLRVKGSFVQAPQHLHNCNSQANWGELQVVA